MISIHNLSFSYKKNKPVLNELNLDLKLNTINGIVGLNGAGKTTLLNVIFGLRRIKDGKISLNDKKLTKIDMSFLPTENYFYSNITGEEYLSLFKNDSFDSKKWNELFKLPLDAIIDGYSTGMKKKLAILGVLKQDKKIMILDEPFNGLDIETNRVLRNILIKLKDQNKTIIVTSHIVETLTNLCDVIHYLDSGSIVFSREKKDFPGFENELYDMIERKNIKLLNNLTDNQKD
jgi:ABC-2 type transport system ATP-binding protein